MEKQEIESMLREPARIKWACRRGMLELDVLLTKFLEHGYNELNEQDKYRFIEMLYLPDPELFSLLMGRESAPNEAIEKLIQRIKSYARG